jgi:4-diphosphocytidyl-2-C-methyl-D-erythritol kinase
MLTLSAPAKLNLYLHITGKRADGYHLLDTVFQLIDLHDTLSFNVRTDGVLKLLTPIHGLPDAQHLALKAATLLKAHTACDLGADIAVTKRIPSGAGLGGGSSDAATVLMGLNQLWGCGLSSAQLQALGLQLGADVPFFCSALSTAQAEGIGETLTALPPQRAHYVVIYPDCHVPTPSVFKHPALSWPKTRTTIEHFNHPFEQGLSNDLQTPAQLIAPSIAKALTALTQTPTALGARMSGSGSAVFAQFATHADAQASMHALRSQNAQTNNRWSMWVTRALPSHPVTEQLMTNVPN